MTKHQNAESKNNVSWERAIASLLALSFSLPISFHHYYLVALIMNIKPDSKEDSLGFNWVILLQFVNLLVPRFPYPYVG